MSTKMDPSLPLCEYVKQVVGRYLDDMGNTEPDNLLTFVLEQVEPPLIKEVLRHAQGNQSRAASMLGITRNTLRAKIQRYSITVKKG